MQKILITLPNSIAGTLIMKGFKQGFKSNSCYVLEKDLRELKKEDIERFKPDIILGYDYGFLFSDNEEIKSFIKDYSKNNTTKLVHYFADEPNGRYAYVKKPELFEEYLAYSKEYNVFSFVWDEDFVCDLPDSKFLPLAVNQKAYHTVFEYKEKDYDITFVGRPLTEKRQKILAALIKTFGKKLSIFSYENHFLQSIDDMKNKQFLSDEELEVYKSAYKGFLKTEKDLAHVYSNSKVNLNITLQGKSGLNYRVFEVLASRGFLITDDLSDIHKNFVVSKELEVYKDVADLIDKIKFYLKNPLIAEKIALLGFSNVIKSHSYTARVKKLLDELKK